MQLLSLSRQPTFEVLEVRPHLYVRQQVSDAGNCALIKMQIISPFVDRYFLLTT